MTIMINFLVANLPLTYNDILKQPFLYITSVVSSTYHLALKFYKEIGIGIVLKEYIVARNCYNIRIHQGQKILLGSNYKKLSLNLFISLHLYFIFQKIARWGLAWPSQH